MNIKHLCLLALFYSPISLHAGDKPITLPGLKQDIEFAKAVDVSLTLDAFIPEGEGPFATCILVHGGGFTKGEKQTFIKPLFEPLGHESRSSCSKRIGKSWSSNWRRNRNICVILSTKSPSGKRYWRVIPQK